MLSHSLPHFCPNKLVLSMADGPLTKPSDGTSLFGTFSPIGFPGRHWVRKILQIWTVSPNHNPSTLRALAAESMGVESAHSDWHSKATTKGSSSWYHSPYGSCRSGGIHASGCTWTCLIVIFFCENNDFTVRRCQHIKKVRGKAFFMGNTCCQYG